LALPQVVLELGHADARGAGAVEGACGEQEEHGADAFAAAGHEVGGDVGDDGDGRLGLLAEFLLYQNEVIAQKIEDFRCRRDGNGAHAVLRVAGKASGAE
jgi:hypothetical protein